MRKDCNVKYLILCITAALLLAAPLKAEDQSSADNRSSFSIGAIVWYAWWDPFFKNDISTKFTVIYPHTGRRTAPSSAFLYGPSMTFTIKSRWSISALFVYGDGYRMKTSDWAYKPDPVTPSLNYGQASARVAKYDFDMALAYSVHSYVRIFAGCKVQGYRHRETLQDLDLGSGINHGLQKIGGDAVNVGPGAGIQVTVPLVDSLFLTGSVSGLYLRGSIDARADHAYMTNLVRIREKQLYNIAGFNSALSLAYMIRAAGITIAAGGRYQYLKYFADGFSDSILWGPGYNPIQQYLQELLVGKLRERHYNRKADQFYGVTFSVIYSVDFPDAPRRE